MLQKLAHAVATFKWLCVSFAGRLCSYKSKANVSVIMYTYMYTGSRNLITFLEGAYQAV